MKNEAEIKAEVFGVISRTFNIATDSITETDQIADLSADSIQLFELLLAFEKFYEIETAYDDVVNLHTVKDIIQYISRVKYGLTHAT